MGSVFLQCFDTAGLVTGMTFGPYKCATTEGVGRSGPPKFGRTTPTFYVAVDCSARNWVYHPYFVLYNNLDQGIGPPTLKTWLRPWARKKTRCHLPLKAFFQKLYRVGMVAGQGIQVSTTARVSCEICTNPMTKSDVLNIRRRRLL